MNQLERAADLGADANAVNVWKARALALFGNFKEAIPLLEAAVAKTPTAEIYCALASCYRRAGKLTLARKAIESSLEREPTNVSNLIERGRIILEQGDVANARENFERVINLDPQNATAHQLLGECFQASGKRIELPASIKKRSRSIPNKRRGITDSPKLYESRRETSSAIQHYQNATDLAQNRTRIRTRRRTTWRHSPALTPDLTIWLTPPISLIAPSSCATTFKRGGRSAARSISR